MTVTITTDDGIQKFENVTKINMFLAFSAFDNTIEIQQKEKKTKIEQWKVIDMEVTD